METVSALRTKHTLRQFKSYYVVWKPLPSGGGMSEQKVFKSYYVVWKQIWLNDKDSSDVGLNRTMQYGNVSDIQMSEVPKKV